MTKFVIEREHQLTMDECRQLSEDVADSLIKSYGGSKRVSGDAVHYKHMSGSTGVLSYDESLLTVDVKLSFLMRPMAAAIKGEINRQCDKRLS